MTSITSSFVLGALTSGFAIGTSCSMTKTILKAKQGEISKERALLEVCAKAAALGVVVLSTAVLINIPTSLLLALACTAYASTEVRNLRDTLQMGAPASSSPSLWNRFVKVLPSFGK